MKRAIAIAAILLGVAGSAALHARDGAEGDGIPSVTVHAERFARRVTAEGTLHAVHVTPIVVPSLDGVWFQRRLSWTAPDGSLVKDNDVVVRFDGAEAEKQLRIAKNALVTAETSLREAQISAAASVADRRQDAVYAAQEAEDKRRFGAKDPLVFSHNDILEAELDERIATERQHQAERALDTERRVTRSSIELAVINRQRAQLAVDHAQDALDHLEIRAPGDGIFVLHRNDSGDPIKLGTSMMSDEPIAVIPRLDVMTAELFVLELDGSGLEAGQPADVVLESRPDLVFHGKLDDIDKLAKPRLAWLPVRYFAVSVALDRTDPAVMKPGERVHATLTLDRRDAIVVPRQAVFEKDGKTLVYRRGAHGYTAVAVELGAASPGRVAIASGLADGDVIATRDPTQSPEPPPAGGSGEPKGTP